MNYWKSIRELFLAGLVAGGRQAFAILWLIVTVRILLRNSCGTFSCDSRATLLGDGVPLLAWSFLLTAMGCALTRDRSVDITADRMRLASQNMMPSSPTAASKILFTQCSIAAAALAVTGLIDPPILMSKVWCSTECGWLIRVAWAALFSLVAATFGASAHAAYRALR